MTQDNGATGRSDDVTTAWSRPGTAVIVIIRAASSLTVMAGATIAPSLPGLRGISPIRRTRSSWHASH